MNAYAQAMVRGEPFIRLTLDVEQPLELGDFVYAFTSLGAEYERYARLTDPDNSSHATLYVSDVHKGSIIADLIPMLQTVLPFVADNAARIIAVEDFVTRYGGRLLAYAQRRRVPDASRAELINFHQQVAAIAHHPGARLRVAAMEVQDGAYYAKTAFEFDTGQARTIQEQVEFHQREIEQGSGDRYERALMTFTRSDIRTTAVGKRSGEQVVISDISARSMPIIYASELAERAIKFEITEAEDNVFKKGFVVDVTVQHRAGRPVAYRITNLHQVIDIPDDVEG